MKIKKVFDFKLTEKEKKRAFNIKKWLMIGLAALAIHFVILAPFRGMWEGWRIVISAVGAFIVAEYLEAKAY